MFKTLTTFVCIASLLLVSNVRPAEAQVSTLRAVSFGDSLTDNEYLSWLFPVPQYVYGVDPFEAAFNKASMPGDTLVSYAQLGTTSGEVLAQVDTYLLHMEMGLVDSPTLVSIEGGGNDIIFNLLSDYPSLLYFAPGEDPETDGIMNRIVQNLRLAAMKMRTQTDANVVVWTLPDIASIPLVSGAGIPEFLLDNLRAHIAGANKRIVQFSRPNGISVLDLNAVNRSLVNDPPTLFGVTLVGPPVFGFSQAIFADPIHPSGVSNGYIANELIRVLNEDYGDTIPEYSEVELAILAGIL